MYVGPVNVAHDNRREFANGLDDYSGTWLVHEKEAPESHLNVNLINCLCYLLVYVIKETVRIIVAFQYAYLNTTLEYNRPRL